MRSAAATAVEAEAGFTEAVEAEAGFMEAVVADSMAAEVAGFTAVEAEAFAAAGRLAARGEGLADPVAVARTEARADLADLVAVVRSGARGDLVDLAEVHSADREEAVHLVGRAADRSEA